MIEGPLADAARSAPTTAGVYFFLDGSRQLLYVGKATNLRRRLQQHAKEVPHSGASKYARVRTVHWEELADDDAAHRREADLVVALAPAQNASLVGDGRWAYVVIGGADRSDERTFSLVSSPRPLARHAYGCFPHLGKGQSSRPGIACSDGYTALLRLLWATGPSGRRRPYPRTISGPSPPFDVTIAIAPDRRPALHRFLSGTSARLLDELTAAVEDVEAVLRPALVRDLTLARGFFDDGPAALRRLRLRHKIDAGPIDRETITSLLLAEVCAAIGEVVLPGRSERARSPFLGHSLPSPAGER